MKLHRKNQVTTFVFLFLFISLAGAEISREKIAVIQLTTDQSAKKSAALTEKIMDEIFKMDLFVAIGQPRVQETMAAEDMTESGCTDKICATILGEILGAQKVIFGTVKKKGTDFKIQLKMMDVKTGKIVRRCSLAVPGSYNDVLEKGMMRATRGLIGNFFGEHKIAGSKSSSSSRGTNATKISAVLCVGACVGFASASGYYWSRKKRYKDENQELEDEATIRGAVFTGASAASLATSIILFVIKPKNSNVSVNTHISPELSGLTVTCTF